MSKAKKTKVLTGAERKAQLLDAGAKLVAKHGSKNVTRRMVAKAVGCAEGLVSVYMGTTAEAQTAYAKQAKKLGLKEPAKEKQEEIGVKLRAHGPRDPRRARKRSSREVDAIKRKGASSAKASGRATTALPGPPSKKPTGPATRRSPQSPAQPTRSAPERKSAARAPKTPPPSIPEGVARPLANSFP